MIQTIPSERSYETATPLALNYTPGPHDVICDRRKIAREHMGNKHYQKLIQKYSSAYGKAKSKPERSAVVSNVVNSIRAKGAGFIKIDKKTGQWFECGDFLAREKTGQQLRESLGGKYKSSHTSKRGVRKAKNAFFAETMLEHIVQKNQVVSHTIQRLKQEVPKSYLQSDEEILMRFTDANSLMLEAMKADARLVQSTTYMFTECCNTGSDTDDSMSVESTLDFALEWIKSM